MGLEELLTKKPPSEENEEDTDALLPKLAMDYTYGTVLDSEEMLCVPNMIAEKRGVVSSAEAVNKGATEYLVRAVLKFLNYLGYAEAITRSDGEPAIKTLQEEVARRRRQEGAKTVVRFAPRGSSQSMGSIERANKEFWAQLRAMVLQLQARTGVKLKPGDVVLS